MDDIQIGDIVESDVFGRGKVVWLTENGCGVLAKSSTGIGMSEWGSLRKNVRKVSGVTNDGQ